MNYENVKTDLIYFRHGFHGITRIFMYVFRKIRA